MIDDIIKMSESHLETIANLEKECFSTPWSEEGLREELLNPYARFYVATKNDEIVGYIGSHNVLGEVYITNVAVFSPYRKQGVGEALIKHLIGECKNEQSDFLTLEVRKSNSSAIALYEKCGFFTVGERKNFYENPKEDALLMTFYFNK